MVRERSRVQISLLAQLKKRSQLKIKNKNMAKKKKAFVKLQCSDCKNVNYFVNKSKGVVEKKLELKKFCKGERKHTIHKEGKK